MRRIAAICLVVVGLMFLAACTAALPPPDSVLGVITGTVQNAVGQPVADAPVIVERGEGEMQYKLTTNAAGHYEQAGLVPQSYKVTVRAANYAEASTTVRLGARGHKQVNFTLKDK